MGEGGKKCYYNILDIFLSLLCNTVAMGLSKRDQEIYVWFYDIYKYLPHQASINK